MSKRVHEPIDKEFLSSLWFPGGLGMEDGSTIPMNT
jgi:hypothetical protein